MSASHAVLWIDQHEAKLYRLAADGFDASTFARPHGHVRRHAGTTIDRAHPAEAQRYFHDVAHALEDAGDVLVVGPAMAKLELVKHIRAHGGGLAKRIVGVETIDHPTDGQLVAYARAYFELGGAAP